MKFLSALLFSVTVISASAQTLTITPSATTYLAAGGSMTFTVNVTYPGTMSAIGIEIGSVPAGWAMASTGGANVPDIAPRSGDTSSFGFAYATIPPSPLSFTFTVNYPSGLAGNQVFSGIVGQFRTGSSLSTVAVSNIVLTPATSNPGTNTAPAILTQPVNVTINEGGTASFSVVASGTAPLTYQWRRNGLNVSGATGATLSLTQVTAASAGSYSVVVTNVAGSVTSSAATLTVNVVSTAPSIATQPATQTVAVGGSATLSVVATGSSPLGYQWRKNGVNIAGATSATLNLTNVQAIAAGTYTVLVSNAAGSVVSNGAVLTVQSGPIAAATRTYFGTFAGNAGSFALLVRPDKTGVFLGYARASRVALTTRDVVVDAAGRFQFTAVGTGAPAGGAAGGSMGDGAVAADGENHYVIDGAIGSNGSVSGSIAGLNLSFSVPGGATANTTVAVAGFYQAGASGSGATSYTVLGASGEAYVVTVSGPTGDAGRGSVDAAGRIELTTENNARITGTVTAQAATIALNVTQGSAAPLSFIGANNDARTDVEKLINISTRSQTGGGAVLIAGFVITGDQPKPLLVRAIGPTLSVFGVGNPLPAAHLEIVKDGTVVASGNDWGATGNAATIQATAIRVGAFALPAGSRDAALLLTLEPGAYTAVVTSQTAAAGAALVEVYDATVTPIPRGQRLINISTRAMAGSGDSALIAGFVIDGSVPKRVLVRGAGPALAGFGVPGTLARPQLAVRSGDAVLVENAGWATSADKAAIAEMSGRVGAFAFPADSNDAAVIVHLAPGPYTAQVSGVGGAVGTALIEVYELP